MTQQRGPTEGQHRPEALLQGTPDKGKYKPDWVPQEVSHKDILSSWKGVPLWDPGGRPPRKQTLEPKGPVEAMNITAGINAPHQNIALGIVAHRKNPGCAGVESVCQTTLKSQPHTCYPFFHHPMPPPPSQFIFVLRPIERALCRSGRCQGRELAETGIANAAIWWLSHSCHTLSHMSLCHALPHTGALAEEVQHTATAAEYNPCMPQFLLGGILLQCPVCLRNEGECSKRHAEQINKIIYPAPYIP